MIPLYRAHSLIDRLTQYPPLRSVLGRRYEKEFAASTGANLFRGVYDSFAAARDSAPDTRPLGYDNPAAASMYMQRTRQVYPGDYPVLFWLAKLLAGATRIVDLGGHIGITYYAYRNYLDYPANLCWHVHDVPAVMARGRALALEMDRTGQLRFCDRVADLDPISIVMALGSLQYLPDTLAQRLAQLASPPPHLLLAAVPIHPRLSYFTLQSIGTAFCPYRVTAMDQFVGELEALGYTLVDRWASPEKNCFIPFHPQHSLDRYHGFFFSRQPFYKDHAP